MEEPDAGAESAKPPPDPKTSPPLVEALDRAQREGWTRLAVCRDRGTAWALRDDGWAELVVVDEPIGDAGAQAVAARLTSLTSLHLSNSNIGAAGAQDIAARLTSLTSLNLRDTQGQ